MLAGQSTMKVKVIFKMAKEPFDTISGMWYFRITQVVEHIRQSSFDGHVRTPQQFVCVPIPSCLMVICFLLKIIFVTLML